MVCLCECSFVDLLTCLRVVLHAGSYVNIWKKGQNRKPAKAMALSQQYALEKQGLNLRFCISCLVLTSIVRVLGSEVNGSESTW